ncbi:unnamed protein product, partial [Adineta steineri]
MRQEFGQTLNQHLTTQQDLPLTSDYIEEDKFTTMLIGLIRVKDEKYIDEIRSKFESFIFDIIEKTVTSSSKDNNLDKYNKTIVKNN